MPSDAVILEKYYVNVSRCKGGKIVVKQVNNLVDFKTNKWDSLLKKNKCSSANFLVDDSVVKDPITMIFFSSFGAMYGAKMTIRQPSDGMWTLAEILSRTVPEVACLCIDPNILTFERLVLEINKLNVPKNRLVFGFSILPQNLVNDVGFMVKVKKEFSQSRMVVGGLGSNSLAYLPSCSGTFGIEAVLPVDTLIPGPAVLELAAVLKAIYAKDDISREDLRRIVDEESMKYLPDIWQKTQEELNKAYLFSRENFVPLNPGIKRLFFKKSYSEMRSLGAENKRDVITVLTDNSCKQRCWFCSTPKEKRFETVEEEYRYIEKVARLASEVSFNNNDLACDVEKTIKLCEMIAKNKLLIQNKHGKISVSTYDPKLILALKRANFVRIGIGVETFDGNHRAELKGANFRGTIAVEKTIVQMLKLGIVPEINLILFHPKETLKALELTTRKTLKWISKGATVNATVGVNAIPNSYAVFQILKNLKSEKKSVCEIRNEMCNKFELEYIEGENDKLMFPVQWLVLDDQLQKVKHILRKKRLKIIKNLPPELLKITNDNYVPIESFIFLALLANMFKFDGFDNGKSLNGKIREYIVNFKNEVYVGI